MLKYVNLNSLIKKKHHKNYIDNKSKKGYKDKYRYLLKKLKCISNTSKSLNNKQNNKKSISYKKYKNKINNKAFSFEWKKDKFQNDDKNSKNNTINISLYKPFKDKIKNITNEENSNYSELNTYPFNFENIKLLNISNDKEKTHKRKNILIKSNFKKKIPFKHSFPKIQKDLIDIYNNMDSYIKKNYIDLNNNKRKTIVNSSFIKNLGIFTDYIKDNVNQVIKRRILNIKKNLSEEKKINNDIYIPNYKQQKDFKINVILLDNWSNIKLKNYNPLNNYSINRIKTEIDDLKERNGFFKKNHIYRKKGQNYNITENFNKNNNKIQIKKGLSFEKLIKEKSNNIFFENYSCLGEIPSEIIKKNENEIKAYLNILHLSVEYNKKIKELNETIKNNQRKIEANINEIKLKTSKIVENINNASNTSNNLTNDIIFHNCKNIFAKISLRNSFCKINDLKDKFQDNSNKAKNYEKDSIIMQKEFNDKIIELKNEIKNLKNKLEENIESGKKYYLNLLKDGTDNRDIGLSWIIKRLFRLDYFPKLKDFPDYIDNEIYYFLIIKAKNENIILDCLHELGEIKRNINDDKNGKNNYIVKAELKNLFRNNNYGLKEKDFDYNKFKKKLKKLLDGFSYLTINPQIKTKIDELCPVKITQNLDKSKIINKNKDFILQRNKSISYFENRNTEIVDKNDKDILNIIKRVFELKNIIQNSYSTLNKLKKEEINYIKKNVMDNDYNEKTFEINLLKKYINNN